jgi:hypothetical protein
MDTIIAPFMRNLSKRAALSARRFSPEAYHANRRQRLKSLRAVQHLDVERFQLSAVP